jgi:NAD+ synthase (glutamine-hydrolysing)
MVFGMAVSLIHELEAGSETILDQLRERTNDPTFTPKKPQEIVSKLFHTAFMGTKHSSNETRTRAKELAAKIGAYHDDINIDSVVASAESCVSQTSGFHPKFESEGGTKAESLAKENVQARLRMVLSYNLAQLSTSSRGLPSAGRSLLVISSANVDEQLRGYVTKYDCSSGDIAPLGSISKVDAIRFLTWAKTTWNLDVLENFLTAKPTAELKPGMAQYDEVSFSGPHLSTSSVFNLYFLDFKIYGSKLI